MMTKSITPELVKDFWTYMTKTYGTKVCPKPDAVEMQIVGDVLGALGIVDKTAFMERFTTTIGTTIYTPFEPGVEDDKGVWSLWQQVLTCAHEHHHVHQMNTQGVLAFSTSYIGNTSRRATFEAEAYRVEMELDFWRTGKTRPVASYVELAESYGLTEEDLKFFEAFLAVSLPMVKTGAVVDKTANVAIDWLS